MIINKKKNNNPEAVSFQPPLRFRVNWYPVLAKLAVQPLPINNEVFPPHQVSEAERLKTRDTAPRWVGTYGMYRLCTGCQMFPSHQVIVQ